jgi:hypothetical protein
MYTDIYSSVTVCWMFAEIYQCSKEMCPSWLVFGGEQPKKCEQREQQDDGARGGLVGSHARNSSLEVYFSPQN